MKNQLLASCSLALVTLIIASCQTVTKNNPAPPPVAKDTAINQTAKPTDTGYADVNGLKMYYEIYGQGKPLVLLHGAFMTIPLNWSQFIPKLSKGRKVIAVELQGHGRTKDIAREITAEGMSDDISALLKQLKIDSSDILGYSMGAGVAFQFAIRHPEQLRRLVILSGAYANNGWWPEGEKSLKNFNPDILIGSPLEKQYDSFGNDPKHFKEFVMKVMKGDQNHFNWTKEVKSIKAPIFMAIGDADGVRYKHALELFRAKGGGKMGDLLGLPKSRLAIIPGTTHVGMVMQRADWLAPMIIDFLDSDLSEAVPGF